MDPIQSMINSELVMSQASENPSEAESNLTHSVASLQLYSEQENPQEPDESEEDFEHVAYEEIREETAAQENLEHGENIAQDVELHQHVDEEVVEAVSLVGDHESVHTAITNYTSATSYNEELLGNSNLIRSYFDDDATSIGSTLPVDWHEDVLFKKYVEESILSHANQYVESETIIHDLSLVTGPLPEFNTMVDSKQINHFHWTRGAVVAFFKTLPEMPLSVQSAMLRRFFLSPQASEGILSALRVSSTSAVAVLSLAGFALEAGYILVWRWMWNRDIKGFEVAKRLVNALLATAAATGGGIAGASIGAIAGPVGAIVGGIVGGVAGAISENLLFHKLYKWLFTQSRHKALQQAYDFLQVAPHASNAAINGAYSGLLKVYHPDKGGSPVDYHKLDIYAWMKIEENDDGKASIWKMLNSLYRHSKAFKMYAFKLASIASNKIEEEKSLTSLQNFLSGHGYILNSTSEEEFENFMSIWSLMSPNIQMSIVQELLEKDGNVKNSSLGVCTQDLIQASSSSLVGSVKGSIKTLNEGTLDLLDRVKSAATTYIAEPLTTHAVDAGTAVIGITTYSCISRGDPLVGAAVGVVLCYLFRTSFIPKLTHYLLPHEDKELKNAYDLLGVLPITHEKVVAHVYRRLKREAKENLEHINKLDEAYETIMKSRQKSEAELTKDMIEQPEKMPLESPI
uniref:J domain-containing protein n=1 Tax=Acrobeloides nanus TaxID=290746 RepID=A0A914DHD5_9BILA